MTCGICGYDVEDARGAEHQRRLCSGHIHALYRWLGSSPVTPNAVGAFVVLVRTGSLA